MITYLVIFAWTWGIVGAIWNMHEVLKDPFYVLNNKVKRYIFLIYLVVMIPSAKLAMNQYESNSNFNTGKVGCNERSCTQKQKEIHEKTKT